MGMMISVDELEYKETKESKKMGLGKVHRRTNIYSSRKQLNNPLRINKNGKIICKSVERWIQDDILALYEEIYLKSQKLRLAKDAYNRFISKLEKQHPQHYEEIQKRIRQRASCKKLGVIYIKPGSLHANN